MIDEKVKELIKICSSIFLVLEEKDIASILDKVVDDELEVDNAVEEIIDTPLGAGDPLIVTRDFIEIRDQIFYINVLYGFKKAESRKKVTSRNFDPRKTYCIIINPSPVPSGGDWYTDTKIEFSSQLERDKAWEKLIKTLEGVAAVKFFKTEDYE